VLFKIVTFDFLEIIGCNIIRVELESLVTELSFVEDNEVTEEKDTAIPILVIIVHDGLIDDDLFLERAVFNSFFSVVVELERLLGLFLTVHIIFESFNDWHATLRGLNNFELEITNEVIIVLQRNVRLNCDSFSVFFLIPSGVEIAGKLEESFSWIAVKFLGVLNIFFKILNCWHANSILWSWIWRLSVTLCSFFVIIIEIRILVLRSQVCIADVVIFKSL